VNRLNQRDKRALLILAAAAAVFLAVHFWPSDGFLPSSFRTVQVEEKRLARLRRLAAAAPERQEILKRVQADLTAREKGLIQADTAPQAQAQLLQVVRRLADSQQPPVVLRSTEFAPVKPFGAAYGQVAMTVNLDCGIEQIINLLVDVANQQELIAVTGINFGTAASKQKTVPVRMTIAGIVPLKLVPAKKEGMAF
jgi:hypothetical protein